MRALLLIVTILAGVCPLAARSEPVQLWENTYVGMSREEVLEAVPGAVQSSGSTLMTGAAERARLDDVRLVDEDFSAIFYFDEAGLIQVTITLDDADAFSLGELESICRDTVAALMAQYGEPFESRTLKDVLTIHTSDWYESGISIGVVCMTIEGDVNLLNVNYQTVR